MNIAAFVHRVATGSRRKRNLLTPVGLLIFGASLVLVVVGGVVTDRLLQLPPLLPGLLGSTFGILLLLAGSSLCGWCVARFLRAKGTPVPINPPSELIVEGPYLWVRNPMLSGVFAALFGGGFLFHSFSMVLGWIPAYMILHIVELKLIEEPELERRFGVSYVEYKQRVPMFFPKFNKSSYGR